MQYLKFTNKSNEKLAGVIYKPKKPRKKICVVVCHGFTGNKERDWILCICRRVADIGLWAVRFDFSGNGKSEGNFMHASFTKEADDLHSVIDELVQRGFSSFVTVGHSMGAMVCLLEAINDKRIIGIVNISGTGDIKKFITQCFQMQKNNKKISYRYIKKDGRMFFVSRKFIKAALEINPSSLVKKLKIPVLFIHGRVDTSVPYQEGRMLFKYYGGPKEFVTVQGAGHGFSKKKDKVQIISAVSSWIKDTFFQ